ncbi:sirohydrochlorin chelatase [Varunaivibrio sulfuroxidans]|uniref:Sirohydrochlorin cobaltochelatase n=1 Tax=Varunaivibrio sulfuroxidans TaxID=1773489 RepID=A0A4R3JGU0_9PROT|nr:sirohydrochlorin chelatase [Varunaivibrio sulfuroxidans]TCS65152.1 sirohydrochlorin cobaltochelatase [Varunaivibrio sulfuroxidans]WES29564.1 sirohydrochlorin chelatase [Varunaivibrio sulfuroxidans]
MTNNAPAIMICGHGSRDKGAVDEFNRLAGRLKAQFPGTDIESGFLEFATPVIRDGLEKLKAHGAKKIVCVPAMLFAAGHVKNDLPSEVNTYAHDNPELDLIYAADLGIDARLLQAARARIEAALEAADGRKEVSREDTLLMVVGRGTNDPDANSNVAKVTRMLWEGIGFGWAETSYSGVAFPLVDAGLDHAARLGYKRIVVFPYFLFTGILVRRIYDWTDAAQERFPGIDFIKAGYLNDHSLLIETFADRVRQALEGDNAMNCQLCKYREQIIGREADQGAPQVGHHHHVQGIGTEDDARDHGLAHVHGHSHSHGHSHVHAHGHDHERTAVPADRRDEEG